MNGTIRRIALLWIIGTLLLQTTLVWGNEEPKWFERKVYMTQLTGTVYNLLQEVSEQTGYQFVYDSGIIDSDREVKLPQQEYILRGVIYAITGNRKLQMELIGNHILLSLPPEKDVIIAPIAMKTDNLLIIRGVVADQYSKYPIASATISVDNASIGTVTNQMGIFRIAVPDSLKRATLRVSHIGYESQEFKINGINGALNIALEPRIVPLQEVVIRPVNPTQILRQMLENRKKNYSEVPVYLTSFYREMIERKSKNRDLTEAVIKNYKKGYNEEGNDQAKLIKMRHVYRRAEQDTLLAKMKSGIQSMMLLDVMKILPDFLLVDDIHNPYEYAHVDYTVMDDRMVHVISFEQKKRNKNPLYKGLLYIDADNQALVEAQFEIHPDYVRDATNMFIEKGSRLFKLSLRKAAYTVSYKPAPNGIYYLNYIRGELDFRVRFKKHLFSSSLNVWFETVTCDVERVNVRPFPRSERLSVRSIFSETEHNYDADFWQGFNVIEPETELKEFIMNSLNKVVGI